MAKFRSRFLRTIALPPAMVLFFCLSSFAADTDGRFYSDDADIMTISWENDLFSGRDQNYTNGVRLSYLSSEDQSNWLHTVGSYLPFFDEGAHKRWGIEAGQSMFTPRDIEQDPPDPDDRPYAGWLYGSFNMIADTGAELDHWQLTLGMVGPVSGAAESQRLVHRIVGTRKPSGWGSQLKNEPGIVLSYEHKWRQLYEFTPFGWGLDVTPSVGASIGNVYTHATAGAMARFGYDLPSDYGPPLTRPSLSGSDFFMPNRQFGWYLFAGLENRVVAQNIFLDGNTFRDSPRVEKSPWVGGVQGGIAITYDNTRFAYTHVFRSKEFKGQEISDSYGAVTVSWRF